MPSDGKTSHCLWHGELKNVNLIKDHLMNIHVQLKFNKIFSFSEETFYALSNSVLCQLMHAKDNGYKVMTWHFKPGEQMKSYP